MDVDFPNLKGTIFVVTYGRSGSTLLQSILQTIEGAHISGENFNAIEPLFRSFQRASWAKGEFGQSKTAKNNPWYGAELIDPDAYGADLVDAFVKHIIRPPTDARWLGFKEIRYANFGDELGKALDFMARHFKNCHFVFNTRSAQDVAKSSWWRNMDFAKVGSMVAEMDTRFAHYHGANPRNTILIRYEDYLADPKHLAPMFDLLGEPFDLASIEDVLNVKLSH